MRYIIGTLVIGILLLTGLYVTALSTSAKVTAVNNTTIGLQQAVIVPGSAPQFSCPLQMQSPTPISITNVSGMAVYNVSGIEDYVLSSGASGTITYGLQTSQPGVSIQTNSTGTRVTVTSPSTQATQNSSANITLNSNATFYHQVQVVGTYSVNQTNSTTNVCLSVPNAGTTCSNQSAVPTSSTAIVNQTSSVHNGLASHVKKGAAKANSQAVPMNYSTVSIASASSAPQGTYWMDIGGGPCYGGQTVLFTVGSSPYSGSVSAPQYN